MHDCRNMYQGIYHNTALWMLPKRKLMRQAIAEGGLLYIALGLCFVHCCDPGPCDRSPWEEAFCAVLQICAEYIAVIQTIWQVITKGGLPCTASSLCCAHWWLGRDSGTRWLPASDALHHQSCSLPPRGRPAQQSRLLGFPIVGGSCNCCVCCVPFFPKVRLIWCCGWLQKQRFQADAV